jgi:hypothetical protein
MIPAAIALVMLLATEEVAGATPAPASAPSVSVPAGQISANSQTPVAPPAAVAGAPDSSGKAKALMAAIQDRLKRVQRVHEAARKQRVAMPESCVLARITEVRAIIQIAGDSMAELQEAVRQRDDEGRVYQLNRLGMLAEKAEKAEQAARLCISDELSYVQTTHVKVDIDQGIPEKDPTRLPLDR